MLTHALKIGLRSLATNPLRTFLSTLGVIIGTAALVAVIALGDGVEEYTLGPIVVSAASAIIIGLTFGIYPALRAARLSPIDAIRHE